MISPGGICRACSARATANGYCAKHQNTKKDYKRDYDRFRDSDRTRAMYRSRRWQQVRQVVLRRDILCRSCGHQSAIVVDHILSARLIVDNFGTDAFYDPDRLQGLCKSCHDSKTATESGWTGKRGTTLTEVGDCSNTTIVCGQAGAGKTHYVQEHKASDDLVWDYDIVMAEITGLPMYESLPGAVGSVLAHRDQWIAATRYSTNHCWLIVSNPQASVVKLMVAAGAKLVTLDTPDDVCQQRIRQRFIEVNTKK